MEAINAKAVKNVRGKKSSIKEEPESEYKYEVSIKFNSDFHPVIKFNDIVGIPAGRLEVIFEEAVREFLRERSRVAYAIAHAQKQEEKPSGEVAA